MKKIITVFTLALAVLFYSCRKAMEITDNLTPSVEGVYVLNEGNFGKNNSSLSFYVPDSNRVYQNVFKKVNGRNLGDTGNDILIAGGIAFIVVNNSDKIEVIRVGTHESIGTILLPGASPYKMTIAAGKGFVTNLWRNAVSVIDLSSMQVVIDSIPVGLNPTAILGYGDKVYVCNSGFGKDKTVSVIDASLNIVEKTITVFDNPSALWISNGKLWVLCSGDYGDYSNPNDDTFGKLFAIDIQTDQVVDSIDIGGHPFRLVINENYAYTIKDGGIARINLQTKEVEENFIPGNFYSIGFDPVNRLLYCADAKDYQQNGEVFIYDLSGKKVGSFEAGIIPGSFGFVVSPF